MTPLLLQHLSLYIQQLTSLGMWSEYLSLARDALVSAAAWTACVQPNVLIESSAKMLKIFRPQSWKAKIPQLQLHLYSIFKSHFKSHFMIHRHSPQCCEGRDAQGCYTKPSRGKQRRVAVSVKDRRERGEALLVLFCTGWEQWSVPVFSELTSS